MDRAEEAEVCAAEQLAAALAPPLEVMLPRLRRGRVLDLHALGAAANGALAVNGHELRTASAECRVVVHDNLHAELYGPEGMAQSLRIAVRFTVSGRCGWRGDHGRPRRDMENVAGILGVRLAGGNLPRGVARVPCTPFGSVGALDDVRPECFVRVDGQHHLQAAEAAAGES